jgi:hypothetical protein
MYFAFRLEKGKTHANKRKKKQIKKAIYMKKTSNGQVHFLPMFFPF